MIYKIMSATEWTEVERTQVFLGSAADRRDGFIHLSAGSQVRETAARHFAGQDDLRLLSIAPDALDIRWEPSRGGALFPHLYGPLPFSAVREVHVPAPGRCRRSSLSADPGGVDPTSAFAKASADSRSFSGGWSGRVGGGGGLE